MNDDFREQNTMDFYREAQKQNNNSNLIIVLVSIIGTLVVALIIMLIVFPWSSSAPEPSSESITTEKTASMPPSEASVSTTPAPTVVPTPSPAAAPTPKPPVHYYIRKTFGDVGSQVGAFNSYNNAIAYANRYASQGYEVYDIDGNLIYDPMPDYTPAPVKQTPTMSNGVRYRVRKSPNDSASQIGAFEELQNAINQAQANKSAGYEVYDLNGNLVYAP